MFNRFRRVTTTGRYISEIDGLRFIAISVVVLQHIYQAVSDRHLPINGPIPQAWLLGRLHIGVELFFVISGFVLALPFASHYLRDAPPVSLRKYYWRRVTRLEPPYLLSLLVLYLFVVFYYHIHPRELLPHLLTGAAYLHNFFYHPHHNPINPVAWSLEIEVQFYLVAPLLALIFLVRRKAFRRMGILTILLVDFLVVRELIVRGYSLPYSLAGFLPYFLSGFLVADMYCTDWNENPDAHAAYDLLAVIAAVLLVAYFVTKSLPTFIPYFLHFALVVAAFRGPWFRRFLRLRPVVVIGGMCYTIYLLHFHLIGVLADAAVGISLTPLPWINLLIYVFCFSSVILLVSAPAFLLVEKPCMQKDWPQRLAAAIRTRGKKTVLKTEA